MSFEGATRLPLSLSLLHPSLSLSLSLPIPLRSLSLRVFSTKDTQDKSRPKGKKKFQQYGTRALEDLYSTNPSIFFPLSSCSQLFRLKKTHIHNSCFPSHCPGHSSLCWTLNRGSRRRAQLARTPSLTCSS